jgi:tyrosine aminotransferase
VLTTFLQLGDPTVFGNFPMAKECVQALNEALFKDNFAYTVSAGSKPARQAVADYSNKNTGENVSSDDVLLTSGCSTALEISFRALADPGDNILIPRPAWNYT